MSPLQFRNEASVGMSVQKPQNMDASAIWQFEIV
jgi:hypothetical protein